MVIVPHPDDEALATGGLLLQASDAGAAIRLIFVTSGDNNPWPQRVIEHRWRITDADRLRWGARRRRESLAALACLGISTESTIFLDYTDQGITETLLTRSEGFLVRLTKEINDWRPTLLVTSSELDIHPDHSALAILVRFAISRLDLPQSSLTKMSFLIHSCKPEPSLHNIANIRLLPEQQKRKREAILCHVTQLKLSQKRLLAFALDLEKFIIEPNAGNDSHPVRQADVVNNTLRLKIVMNSNSKALGRTILYLIFYDPENGNMRCFVARVPRKSAEVNVYDLASGTVISRAYFSGSWYQGEMILPQSSFLPMKTVFVKLKCQFGFFDEAGWKEIPLSQTPVDNVRSGFTRRVDALPTPKVCCVIPCYNAALYCGNVVRDAALYADQIIVVNDGSTDGTDEVLRKVEAEYNGRVRVLSFVDNKGKGTALLNGFNYALENVTFDVLITMDADGQHRAADIPRLVRACVNEHAILAIGERTRIFGTVPLRSRFGNTITSMFFRRLYPSSPIDTQSGFRAFKRNFVEEIVCNIRGGKYETELYILILALEKQYPITTIPILALYFNGNRSSHFRAITDSVRICRAIFNRKQYIEIFR